MNWLHYLIEANLYLCIFYLLYRLLLSRETHYNLSRAYLLSVSLISFVLPVLQLGFLRSFETHVQTIDVPASSPVFTTGNIQVQTPLPLYFSWQDGLVYLYFAGAFVFTALLLIKLLRLFILSHQQKAIRNNGFKLIEVDGEITGFSFLSAVFIGSKTPDRETVIRHELVHIRQKHSIDILMLELIKIVSWFNPAVYLLQNSLKAVHEFIADNKTAQDGSGALSYSTFLVNSAYGHAGPSVTHSIFNKNLLKRRIIMLNQKPSSRWARLKYLSILPVCAGLLCLSTLCFSKTYGAVDLMPLKDLPVNKTTGPDIAAILANPGAAEKTSVRTKKYVDTNDHVTAKGYHYTETSMVNKLGKPDLLVNIFLKNQDALKMLKSRTTPAQKRMLEEKYGYTFPSKIPPPPPAPPKAPHGPYVKRFPPPVVVPADNAAPTQPAKHLSPPPPPAQIIMNDADPSKAIPKVKPVSTVLFTPLQTQGNNRPLLIVNNKRYDLKANLRPGEHVYISGADSAVTYSAGDVNAKKKWGNDAKNGVIILWGKPEISIK